MAKCKVAAQLYTLRDHLKTPEDIAKSLKKVSEIGYTAVQVSGMGPIDPQELKNIADAEQLTICATHIAFDQMQNNMDEVIRKHQIWDCKYVGIGGMPNQYKQNAQTIAAFAKEASEIGKQLAEHGMQFIYHNHDWEFAKYDGRTMMDILFEESDPEYFHFELDTYWVQAGGASPEDWIRKVDGRMKVVHFKDMGVTPERKMFMAEIGEGNLSWPGLIKACQDIGVEWCVVEQDICPGDPFDSLAISLANLKKLGLN